MKLLTMLMAAVFTVAVIAPFPTYACSVSAYASTAAGNNAYAYASISANGLNRGGYYLTCTGHSPKSMAFNGGASDSLSSYFSQRAQTSASGSVGGSCPGGGGVQDYDCSQAP